MNVMSDRRQNHVLVFDSGVGGLSVSAEIRRALPDVAQSYLADDAFRPYGEKTEDALRHRLVDLLVPICDMLNPDIVVIACNSASTTALPTLRDALPMPVVGVVPAIKPAARLSKTGSIAVLGTPGTVRRAYVDDLISEFASDKTVALIGSSALVEQAENKMAGRPIDQNVLGAEMSRIFADENSEAPVDTVVLACTHFPLLVEDLNQLVDRPIQWVDSGAAIARRVAHLLRDTQPRSVSPAYPTAFLTAPHTEPARETAFQTFGFERLISLV